MVFCVAISMVCLVLFPHPRKAYTPRFGIVLVAWEL